MQVKEHSLPPDKRAPTQKFWPGAKSCRAQTGQWGSEWKLHCLAFLPLLLGSALITLKLILFFQAYYSKEEGGKIARTFPRLERPLH